MAVNDASVYTASQQQVEAEPCIKYIAIHMGHTSDIHAIMHRLSRAGGTATISIQLLSF